MKLLGAGFLLGCVLLSPARASTQSPSASLVTDSGPLADLRFATEEQEIRARALQDRIDTLSRQAREKAATLHALDNGADSPRYAWAPTTTTPANRERLKRILRVALREQLGEITRLQEQLKEAQIERDWLKLRISEADVSSDTPTELPKPSNNLATFHCQGLPIENTQADGKLPLLQDFGPRRDSETGIEWRSMGWWMGGLGTQVKACAAGTVVFSGKIHGRGRVVMVDHGNGVLTLYANLNEEARLSVTKGTKVKAGMPLGTPLDKFYFEVRRQGLAIDPRQVFAAASLASLSL